MPKETPGVKFPLEITNNNAGYELAEIKETVRFNIKNILLTNPGERVFIPDFGVGIQALIFENARTSNLEAIRDRVIDQISIYASYVDILNLDVIAIDDLSIKLLLNYTITFARIDDFIELHITNI